MTNGEIVQSYRLFYWGKEKLEKGDDLVEFAALYPSYNMLFYTTEQCFSWKKLKDFFTEGGYKIYEVTRNGNELLTITSFESKWLCPSRLPLKRDPLHDRKIEGWLDDEGYAFCARLNDDHLPPSRKLTIGEKTVRYNEDIDVVTQFQLERKAKRLADVKKVRTRRTGRTKLRKT